MPVLLILPSNNSLFPGRFTRARNAEVHLLPVSYHLQSRFLGNDPLDPVYYLPSYMLGYAFLICPRNPSARDKVKPDYEGALISNPSFYRFDRICCFATDRGQILNVRGLLWASFVIDRRNTTTSMSISTRVDRPVMKCP